ncbi:hypothetical protein DH09_12500 [Bacillaceae bacterium JMAK1]|nr:hypothetical protein DH09_12500 [Bacillaceae bacterium JMAK1]
MNKGCSVTFRTRTSYSVVVLMVLAISLFLPLIHLILNAEFVAAIVITAIILPIVPIFIIHYEICDDMLRIRFGFVITAMTIPIKDITMIQPTKSLLSSPAASLTDRIELSRGNGEMPVIISPKDRDGLLDQLIQIHSKIELDERLNTNKSR